MHRDVLRWGLWKRELRFAIGVRLQVQRPAVGGWERLSLVVQLGNRDRLLLKCFPGADIYDADCDRLSGAAARAEHERTRQKAPIAKLHHISIHCALPWSLRIAATGSGCDLLLSSGRLPVRVRFRLPPSLHSGPPVRFLGTTAMGICGQARRVCPVGCSGQRADSIGSRANATFDTCMMRLQQTPLAATGRFCRSQRSGGSLSLAFPSRR